MSVSEKIAVVVFAALVATLWAGWLFAKRAGMSREAYVNLATWIAFGILVGGIILVSNINF